MSAPAPISIPPRFRPRIDDDIPVSAGGSSPRSIAVFSGGSAMNTFVTLLQQSTDDTAYIMPVSDDAGGSTSEIIKVLGGPGIGDLRSRVVRLAETASAESRAVHDLLSYRLPFDTTTTPTGFQRPSAKTEWLEMLEGRHPLWRGISHPYRETIRTFLAHFQHELFRSATRRPEFDFQGGSIGNFFLTGSRLFFDDLDAAIFQFTRIMRCPPRTEVVPVVATTRGSVTLAAAQRDGRIIFGQCEISHPGQVVPERPGNSRTGSTESLPTAPRDRGGSFQQGGDDEEDEATRYPLLGVPQQGARLLPRVMSQNLIFDKHACTPLASPIRRIYYVNRERQEIFPDLNPLVPAQLARKRTIMYGCGSLYTSILPCLVVPGVGRLLADGGASASTSARTKRPAVPSPFPVRTPLSRVKVLLLNGSHDRETMGYEALDFILAITDALNYSCMIDERRSTLSGDETLRSPSSIARAIASDIDGRVHAGDRDGDGRPTGLEWWLGDHPATSATSSTSRPGTTSGSGMKACRTLESKNGRTYLGSPYEPRAYITHMLYPEEGAVMVDVDAIEALGIRCVRVRAAPGSGSDPAQKGLYGIEELREVLDHLIM
ncbi:hypothetical protein HKX48_002117 [Thoreauomyces humboldtii]|nr:hypothetical protein HKX48_002117 [Thoreauomyces humboldtii]